MTEIVARVQKVSQAKTNCKIYFPVASFWRRRAILLPAFHSFDNVSGFESDFKICGFSRVFSLPCCLARLTISRYLSLKSTFSRFVVAQ